MAKLMARQADVYVERWESRFGADGAPLAYRFRLLHTAGIGMMLVVMVVIPSLAVAGFRSPVVFWIAMVLAASPAIVGTFLLGRTINLVKAHCGIPLWRIGTVPVSRPSPASLAPCLLPRAA